MDNLILSFNIIFPMFLLMALGYTLKATGILDGHTMKKMNAAIFKAFLPALIFYNVYTSELAEIFDKKLVLYSALSVVASYVILMLVVPVFEKDNRKRGVIVQGIFRSNFVIFGIPMSVSMYGDSIVGSAAVLIAIVVPIYNFLSVIALEVFRRGRPDVKKIFKVIITNPLIIASIAGIAAAAAGLRLPGVLEKTLGDIAGIATPLALVILGASVNFKRVKGNTPQLVSCVCGRLVVIPAVFLSIAVLLGFRNEQLAILVSVFASPTAVSSFAMAQQMGGDDELAAQIVAFCTTLCIITVFLWIFVLKQAGFM